MNPVYQHHSNKRLLLATARSIGIMLSLWVLFLMLVLPARGATNYVSLTGGHIPPFDSWANAATNLACAALLMQESDTLRVAPGTYRMVSGSCTNTAIRGAWIGEQGPGLTILDFSGLHDSVSLGATASLRGFTVRDFQSQVPFVGEPTGAIALNGGSLLDCHFKNNQAEFGKGGAITGNGLIEDCVFEGNAANMGGGVFVNPPGSQSDRWMTIRRCHFMLNEGLQGVGAVDATTCASSTNLFIEACTFVDNYTILGEAACLDGNFDVISSNFSGHKIHTNEHSFGQYLAEPFVVSGQGSLESSLHGANFFENEVPLVRQARLDAFQAYSNKCGQALMRNVEARGGKISECSAGIVLDNCTAYRCRVISTRSGTTASGCRLSNCYLYGNTANSCMDGGMIIFTTFAYNNAMGMFFGSATNSVICGSNPEQPFMPGLRNVAFQAKNCNIDGLEKMLDYIQLGGLDQIYETKHEGVIDCDTHAHRSSSPSFGINSCIFGKGSLAGIEFEDAIDLYGNVRLPHQPVDLGCRQFSFPADPAPVSVAVQLPARVAIGAKVEVVPFFEGHIQDTSCRIETPGGEFLYEYSFSPLSTGLYRCVVTAVHAGGATSGQGWVDVQPPRKIVATGNPNEMGCSADCIVTNLVHAVELAVPGERVLVKAGVYDATTLPISTVDANFVLCVPRQVSVEPEDSNGSYLLLGHPSKSLLYLNDFSSMSGFVARSFQANVAGDAIIKCRESSILRNIVVEDSGTNNGGSVLQGGVIKKSLFRRCNAGFSSARFEECVFSNNFGNFIFSFSKFRSCLIARNIIPDGYVPEFLNCTLVNNYGAGLMTLWSGTRFVNSIVSHNYDSSSVNLAFGLLQNSHISTNDYSNEVVDHFVFSMPPGPVPPFSEPLVGLGDYRLKPDSGFVDMGVVMEELVNAADLTGAPRIGNRRVDIGAFEFYFDGGIRARLQGPLSAVTGLMSTNAPVALQSPYASDPRVATAIPSNTVDWVLLELYGRTNQPPVFSRSVFLRDDGQLMTEGGDPVVPIDVTPMTNYWVAVKHRGHLASITASAVPFTNNVVDIDFTPGPSAYLGGTNVAVQVGTNWAARAGDVDGDGLIGALDAAIVASQAGNTANSPSDVNRDGAIDGADAAFIAANLDRATPGFDTALSPALRITPDRRTLVSGETLALLSDGGPGTRWAYAANRTGSTLSATNGPALAYTAGPTPGLVDVLQAWDPADGRVGRTYLNVISPAEVAALGKAVILAGGRSLDDPVWPATDYLSAKAHTALRYRGYSRDTLLHLNFQPGRDLDGDGLDNDIDGPSDLQSLDDAFSTFLPDASQVFFYLVDHGTSVQSNGLFRLNATEFLSADAFDAYLDAFQDATDRDVVVVLDFCYAGAFAQQLSYTGLPKRLVLAATQPAQPTYFIAGGQVSYSEYFWNGVYQGLNLRQAHELGTATMLPYQQGWLDDNADGTSGPADGALAATRVVGAGFVAGKNYPLIERALEGQALEGTTEAVLWVELINSAYPVDRVWCTITPPNYSVNANTGVPVVDIPVRDLTRNPVSGRWEFDYDGFTQEGPYIVNFFARDIWNSVSPPKTVTIDQRGFDERVILVAGGAVDGIEAPATRALARTVFTTLRARLVSTNEIQLLSMDPFLDFDAPGTNQVDRACTRAQLQQAFQNPQTGVDGSDKLTVWLVGAASNGLFRLNATETLSASDLAGWLGHYQRNGAKAQVILDFAGAGSWLPSLRPVGTVERIVLAGSEAHRPAVRRDDLSLSGVICSAVNQGQTLGAAADRARRVVRRASGNLRQKVLIDDNSNGVANEKNLDGRIAAQRYVGSAFVTGEDRPVIGEVPPDQVITNGQSLVIWAGSVSDATGISNVWVNITAPGNWQEALTTRQELAFQEATGRWEAEWPPNSEPGVYVLGFQAMDTHSNLSEVVQSRVIVEDAGQTTRRLPHLPDPFEPDADCAEAPILDLPVTQTRSLHLSNDVETIRFFAQSNLIYDIETVHLTNTVDTVIEIHRVLPDGSTVLIDRIDEFGATEGELGGLDFPEEGIYCVRVTHADGEPYAPGAYVLVIHVPAGFTGINITARNLATQTALVGATATLRTAGGTFLQSASVDSSGVAKFLQPVGNYQVEVTPPPGFVPLFDPANPNRVPENPNSSYGNHRNLSTSGFGTVTYGTDAGSTAAYLGYYFVPGLAVTGTVVDAITHEPLSAVSLSLRRASDNTLFDRYPWASYGTLWNSAQGALPARLIVPPQTDYTLTLSAAGFTNGLQTITTPATGPYNLGRLTLNPVDSDADGLPDAWEQANFGNLAQTASGNADGDAFSNADEFRSGTHPNQAASELRMVEPETIGNTITLRWPASANRRYVITSAPAPNGPWAEEAVLSPATIAEGHATWIAPVPDERRYYRVESSFLP